MWRKELIFDKLTSGNPSQAAGGARPTVGGRVDARVMRVRAKVRTMLIPSSHFSTYLNLLEQLY